MSDIDPITGLPRELSVWESIAKEDQRITVQTVQRKFGKTITVVSGFDARSINIKEIAKKLKSKLACGGTVKENNIELQGDHKSKVREELIKLGFARETIEVR
ncbi:MAG TPA: translation initiation factor [Candidatus Nanoarchaeia archaeon]|nr:translation initiation factor [Candidatus Nanoarchaeia archaeon]